MKRVLYHLFLSEVAKWQRLRIVGKEYNLLCSTSVVASTKILPRAVVVVVLSITVTQS